METVSIQIPAKLFSAIYARHEGNTGNIINQCLTQLLEVVDSDSSPKSNSHFMRPGKGTITRRVWDIADTFLREAGKPDRSEVVRICKQEGININTANTQYSHWKNANIDSEE